MFAICNCASADSYRGAGAYTPYSYDRQYAYHENGYGQNTAYAHSNAEKAQSQPPFTSQAYQAPAVDPVEEDR